MKKSRGCFIDKTGETVFCFSNTQKYGQRIRHIANQGIQDNEKEELIMSNTVLYDVQNHIGIVQINRENYRNAFGETTYQEIIDIMNEIDQDDNVKVAVITGVGNHFSAGGDVNYFQQLIDDGQEITEEMVLLTGKMVKSVKQNSKPVIAAVNGVAAGAGLGLAMACDFIVMGESSQLVTAFIQMAFPGDTALLYTLQQAIGTFRTTRHVMLGEPITAKMAEEYGIAFAVVKDEEMKDVVTQLAGHLATGPTTALGYQKALLNQIFYPGIDEFNQGEAIYMNKASKSADHKEAVDAFLNKRRPDFQ